MTIEDTISQLNSLIEVSKNGELGYAEAARLVEDTQLQTVFQDYSKERAGFVRALHAEVQKLGGTPAESGTLGAAIHRGWMELKAAATLGSGTAILAACQTGEDSAWTRYEHASDSGISGASRELVDHQWQKIKEAIAHLEHLQKELEAEEKE